MNPKQHGILASISAVNAEAADGAPDIAEECDLFSSRRDILRVASKAVWVVPVVQTLSAASALGAGSVRFSGPSCVAALGPCNTDADCCSGTCTVGFCQ